MLGSCIVVMGGQHGAARLWQVHGACASTGYLAGNPTRPGLGGYTRRTRRVSNFEPGSDPAPG